MIFGTGELMLSMRGKIGNTQPAALTQKSLQLDVVHVGEVP